MDNGTEERAVQKVIRLTNYSRGMWNVILTDANPVIHRQQKWGLNTYLYAPKDDYKHRMFWRELYSVEEAGNLFRFNPFPILVWS